VKFRLNMEAAQLVVGAALTDSRFRDHLIGERERALRSVDGLAVTPGHVRLTAGDRRVLGAIVAGDLAEFARGVERLQRTLRPARRPALQPADVGEALAG
jgi:hypothetical protein